jgi:beta-glucanase (GH16 family)
MSMWYATLQRRRSSVVACALILSLCAVVHVSPAVAKDGAPRKVDPPKPAKPRPSRPDHRPTRPRHDVATVITVTSVTDSTISIEWIRGRNGWRRGGVVGYRLFTNGSWVASTGNTRYTFTNLSCATAYVLGVAGYNAGGKQWPEAFVMANTDACRDRTAPTAPGNVRVSEATRSSVTIAWDASRDDVGVIGYGIYVAGRQVDSTGATSFTLGGIHCGTTLRLAADAYDAAGNRSAPVEVTARTDACPDTSAPTTPGNLRVTGTTTSSVTVAWDAANDDVAVAGYGIYAAGISIDTAGAGATSYTLSGLLCGTSRLVTVDAYDAAGNRSQQASVSAGTDACEDTAPAPIAGQGYTMKFHDEFDTLGSLAWGESDWFSDNPTSQVFVNDGVLNLVSRRADGYPNITVSGQASPHSFKQGYFETRMRWTKGAGAWPAFWLLSQRHLSNPAWPQLNPYCADNGLPAAECWSAELDVFEGQGTQPTTFYGTVHRNSAEIYGLADSQNENNTHDVGIDLTADFHTYGMLWTPTEIRWYLDGQFVHSAPVYDSTNQPMYLLMDLWIGGWTTGTDETTPDELKAEFDWVRVWQK